MKKARDFLAWHLFFFIQVLKYMVFEWEKDYNNNKQPRVIIPVVFYHGADHWKIPRSFAEQFDVDDEVKPFLLDYRYVLFDTNPWDFRDESNKELKENVFLFTSMVLMKAAYKNDTEAIQEIFNFWYDKGFIENVDIVLFFLGYISHTHDITRDKLKKMLDKSKIDGGEQNKNKTQHISYCLIFIGLYFQFSSSDMNPISIFDVFETA